MTMLAIAGCGAASGAATSTDTAAILPPSPAPRSATHLLTRPVPPPAAIALSHVGPYRFVRAPLVTRPGNRANAGNDDVDVFLRMSRPLPLGRVYVTVNGDGPALTAGGTGVDTVSTDATHWCYEVTIGNTETLTNVVHHYRLGEVVTVAVQVFREGTTGDDGRRSPSGTPGTARARVLLGRDSFPARRRP